MLCDRLAECDALLGVVDAEFECPIGEPAGASGNVNAADFDAVHHLVETLANLAAEKRVRGEHEVLHDQFSRIDALVAHLVDLAGNRQAWKYLAEASGLLNEECRHLLVDTGTFWGIFIGANQYGAKR